MQSCTTSKVLQHEFNIVFTTSYLQQDATIKLKEYPFKPCFYYIYKVLKQDYK